MHSEKILQNELLTILFRKIIPVFGKCSTTVLFVQKCVNYAISILRFKERTWRPPLFISILKQTYLHQ